MSYIETVELIVHDDGIHSIDEIGQIGPYIEDKTICVTDPLGDTLITNFASYYPVGQKLDGWNLYHVAGFLTTPSSVEAVTIQIYSLRYGIDILTTPITIDANEISSYTSGTTATVNPLYSEVQKGEILKPRVVEPGTGAKGLFIYFELIR